MDAGYDAIEIHAHAGYLIDQFLSPVWNKRTDEYGGTPEKNTRFAKDIYHAIREVVGPNVPILFRISLDHRFNGGRDLEYSMKILKELEKEGIDAFDIDAGCYETLDYIFPPAYLGESCMSYVCEDARKAVNVPLINAGSHNPDSALELIESGNADFASFGRALIADPMMPKKLMKNHSEDVRPCLRCNEYCIGRIWNHHTKLGCAVNPQAMEEVRFKLEKTEDPQNVVVIGAGPGGMEAARVAALEGHHVTLFEKEDHLGGTMVDICTAQFKSNIKKLTEWYKVQLSKLPIDIHLNTTITGEEDILKTCDAIIVSTGATPFTPSIPGIDGKNVVNIVAAHKNELLIKGDKIVICGGGASGLDGAIEIAEEMHKDVTVVEMLPEMGKDVFFINKISLFNKLVENNVKLMTNTKVTAIDETGLTVEENGIEKHIEADIVISAFGMRPNTTLSDLLKEKYPMKTRAIGDCDKLGKIGEAVREGFYAASSLD